MLLEAGFASARESRCPEFRCTVTFHDACHLVHGLGVRESPRKLLRSIPGVTLVEMAESDLCCGSAGSYNLTEPATAREAGAPQGRECLATGAEFVVLSNPGCEFQIAAELRRRGSKTRVAWPGRLPRDGGAVAGRAGLTVRPHRDEINAGTGHFDGSRR